MKTPLSSIVIAFALLAALPLRAAPPSPEQQAVHVLNRLAYGPRPGDIERVTRMGVQRYIDSQLNPETIAYPPALSERLRTLDSANRPAGEALAEFVALRKEARSQEEGAVQRRRAGLARLVRETAEARVLRAVDSPRQLEEVMVDFWFNHFNVFSGKGIDRALVASYERDAIRPYVFGTFRQLLGATARHPAMLYYLDNYLSTSNDYLPRGAPGAAKAGARGLNENYARELMELHTLGVDGGYSQHDVTELARMLTGWTFDQRRLVRNNETFRFDPQRHDQGAKTWMGRRIEAQGQQEGELALDVLAQHPATARHLSYKLAQYFVQDAPPPALVERLAATWTDSHGDIRTVLRVLFASPEFMAAPSMGAKFKTPYQYVISAARATAAPTGDISPLVRTMGQLGMPLYGCQTPDGYQNTQAAWLNPDALSRRIAFATALASGRLAPANRAEPANGADPALSASAALPARATTDADALPAMGTIAPAIAPPMVTYTASSAAMAQAQAAAVVVDATQLASTLGPAISRGTLDTVARHPPNLRAAMLLGSPDFMQH